MGFKPGHKLAKGRPLGSINPSAPLIPPGLLSNRALSRFGGEGMKLDAVPEPPARNAHLNARRTWSGATIYANLRPAQTQNRRKKEPRCVKAGFEGEAPPTR
jgi:hypothetical protein